MTGPLAALDVAVILVYFAAVVAVGLTLAGTQRDSRDYFLGRRDLPWWSICFSIVATETSALTVISIPGIGARGNWTFLQIAFGYLIGRIGVAWLLLPGYFHGTQETAYERLGTRFGPQARRVASGFFSVTRALGDGVRVYAVAIPLSIVTGWPEWFSILAIGLATLLYTFIGGLRAVVWVDVVQLAVYTVGGIATILVATSLAGGLDGILTAAADADKLQVLDWSVNLTTTYTVLGGLVGGAFLSAASHGTDHLLVQRLLAARQLSDARRALIGSGVLVIGQFALFLFVGTVLWAAGADQEGLRGDAIYPSFIVEHLPAGLAGLVVAGLLAAAMSTVSSSLNSLASGTTNDFYAPLTGKTDRRHLLRVGRWATVAWAIILVGGAIAFLTSARDAPVVVLALSIASLTYGPLLGAYVLAFAQRVTQRDAILAMAITTIVMTMVVLGFPIRLLDGLAWPWYVPLGTGLCVAVGLTSSMLVTPGRGVGRDG